MRKHLWLWTGIQHWVCHSYLGSSIYIYIAMTHMEVWNTFLFLFTNFNWKHCPSKWAFSSLTKKRIMLNVMLHLREHVLGKLAWNVTIFKQQTVASNTEVQTARCQMINPLLMAVWPSLSCKLWHYVTTMIVWRTKKCFCFGHRCVKICKNSIATWLKPQHCQSIDSPVGIIQPWPNVCNLILILSTSTFNLFKTLALYLCFHYTAEK